MGSPSPDPRDEPALLAILDGLVRRDGAASGLRHEVCVGVEHDGAYRWWHARLGMRFTCGFLEGPSPTAHVTMTLTDDAAESALRSGTLAEGVHVDGDRAVLAKFIERYTSRTNPFGARVASIQARRDLGGRKRR